jgi:PadR family transcriptional regulator PadR
MADMRMTVPTALILSAIAGGSRHGFDIMDATGLPSGTVYPALRRLDSRGFVRSRWEPAEKALDAGRPRRRIYELSERGVALLPSAQARLASLPRLRAGRILDSAGS